VANFSHFLEDPNNEDETSSLEALFVYYMGSIPGRHTIIYLHSVRIRSRANPVCSEMNTGKKRPKREADHSLHLVSRLRIVVFISTPPA